MRKWSAKPSAHSVCMTRAWSANLASARDRVAAAKAQVEVITRGSSSRAGSVNTTEVRSSMNGIVLNVPVKVGTSVSGSSSFSEGTTIATVANMNDIIFSGNIDETEVAKLHVGDSRCHARCENTSHTGLYRSRGYHAERCQNV